MLMYSAFGIAYEIKHLFENKPKVIICVFILNFVELSNENIFNFYNHH